MRTLIIFLIRTYQKTLSPQTGLLKSLYFSPIFSLTPGESGCRYSITCSEYTILQFREEKSLSKAFINSTRRILSCH